MSTDIANFVSFVNLELPKRLSTEASPLDVPAGQIPVSTGVGLGVEFKNPADVHAKIGLITAHNLSLRDDGTVVLPKNPYGGVLFDIALIFQNDGSVIEVIGVSVRDGNILVLPVNDYNSIKETALSVTVSFIGDL